MYRLILLVAFLLPGTVSAQISIGEALPDAPLEYMTGGATSTHALAGDQGIVIVFWSNDCTWTDQYKSRLQALNTADVPIILVNSNDASVFPKEGEIGQQYEIPYVRDLAGGLAKTLGAQRTPHVFVFDGQKRLAYSGGIDDSPADAQITQENWLQDAITQLSTGQSMTVSQTKSFGCRIKLP
ncbi:MAG: redoxin domain-containing protein [Bacteroidetes bacterium]|nr:redoxin domain-containing protein [Bacteroidota bacterium]MCY4205948.1 redoxin domain-containing protein [Bacteroidota bacterium]